MSEIYCCQCLDEEFTCHGTDCNEKSCDHFSKDCNYRQKCHQLEYTELKNEIAQLDFSFHNQFVVQQQLIEKLTKDNERLVDDWKMINMSCTLLDANNNKLRAENKELKEMLRRFDTHETNGGCYCICCNGIIPDHKENCDYIRLT
jgi:hypothetical protein